MPAPSTALAGSLVRLSSDSKPYWCSGTAWVDLTQTSASGSSPGGNTGELQYNDAGAFAGAANVEIDSGDLTIVSGTPTTPPTDKVKFFGKRFGPSGGRVMPAAIGPSGLDYTLQPAIWRQKISRWNAAGNVTTVPGVDGMGALTAGGTATARNVATTNTLVRAKRLGYVSSGATGNYGGHYAPAAQITVGNGSNVGGFFYSCRFGISDAALIAVARTFVGLSSSVAAPTNVEPSTLTNCLGVGNNASAANLSVFYGGSAAQTPIDLGANFPVSTSELYDVTFWAPPNQNGLVYYNVERVGTAFTASGTLGPGTVGTTVPANTTLLAHRAWRFNNSANAVGIDISNIYIETDW